ncbi:MAG: phenylalanine--tRNA ligase subunit alpha [Candidatus Marsarchaeota archaeon]|nr:phenylalanine--tRNA ligase subunit alpha [Candidatus Marsarchaeota archaeon]
MALLDFITNDWIEVSTLSLKTKTPESSISSQVEMLERDELVELKWSEEKKTELTKEGLKYLEIGTPEKRLYEKAEDGVFLNEALKKSSLTDDEKAIAIKWSKEFKTIDFRQKIKRLKENFVADEALKELKENGFTKWLSILEKRGLCQSKAVKKIFVRKTGLKQERVATQLTPEMIRTGEWRNAKFKEYDLNTLIAPVQGGKKQAYLEFLHRIKEELISLGFEETHGPLVELEFYNLDALFMAQDHPSREMHDLFRVKEPEFGILEDERLIQRVKKAHEKGVEGSKGWGYKWSEKTASRTILRSQGTAISARNMIKGLKPPAKLFSISRVFRPDEIDWKHFIEFYQCEGIVADESVNFSQLLGYLKQFMVDIAKAKRVKFFPSYFPFTEPSVEFFAEVPGKGWIEMGGAGIFRPEVTKMLGVDVPVLAWGIGIDRLALLNLGIMDIRDLFSQDINFLEDRW